MAKEATQAESAAAATTTAEAGFLDQIIKATKPRSDTQIETAKRTLQEFVGKLLEPGAVVSNGDAEGGIPGAARRAAGRREPKVYGSAVFVTGAFGLAAAAAVVHRLSGVEPRSHRVLSEKELARRRKR